jgi:hypothetical protein
MDRPVFFSDQLVVADDLNAIQSTFNAQVILRTLANLTIASSSVPNAERHGGVFGSSLESTEDRNLRVTRIDGGNIRVAAGIALEPSGEIIYVPTAFTIATGSVGLSYTWTGTTSATYYIKINYQESPNHYRSSDFGVSSPTWYTPGYYVTVDTAVPVADEICLATASVSGGAIVGVKDARFYVTISNPAQGVVLDPTLNQVPEVKSAYDHIMALGTGTVTATNPHGLGPADIGASSLAESSFFGTSTIGVAVLNTVYQNTSTHAIYFEANVETTSAGYGTINAYAVYASPAGTTTGTGSLTGPVYEIARFASTLKQANTADTAKMQEPIRGLIPPQWYYKVWLPAGTPTGTIKFTTTSV